MIKEKPISFSSTMVKAILEGRKTQTRRVIMPQPVELKPLGPRGTMIPYYRAKDLADMPGVPFMKPCRCPYQISQKLWVRETWAAPASYDKFLPSEIPEGEEIWFSDNLGWKKDIRMGKVRSAWFMCKWMARLWIEVTDIRVQQLQNIENDYDDVLAEGIKQKWICINPSIGSYADNNIYDDYQRLWDSLNSKRGYSWKSNPWVWVYDFIKIAPL